MSLDKDGNGQERLAMLFGLPVVTACAAADRHCRTHFLLGRVRVGGCGSSSFFNPSCVYTYSAGCAAYFVTECPTIAVGGLYWLPSCI